MQVYMIFRVPRGAFAVWGQISRNGGGRHPDRWSGLGQRRASGAFSTEHERQTARSAVADPCPAPEGRSLPQPRAKHRRCVSPG